MYSTSLVLPVAVSAILLSTVKLTTAVLLIGFIQALIVAIFTETAEIHGIIVHCEE